WRTSRSPLRMLYDLIDDALAVRASNQAKTVDGGLNLAGRTVSHSLRSRRPVAQFLTFLRVQLAAQTLSHLIAARQCEPCFFSFKVEGPHVRVCACSSALRTLGRTLIAICNVLTKITQHGATPKSAHSPT